MWRILFFVFCFFVYLSPDDIEWSNNDTEAIKVGAFFAGNIRNGEKELSTNNLKKLSSFAEKKIKADPMDSISGEQQVYVTKLIMESEKTPKQPHSHRYLLEKLTDATYRFESPDNSVQLIKYERLNSDSIRKSYKDSTIELTFVGIGNPYFASTLHINKIPMTVTVNMTYTSDSNDNYFYMLLRKTVNVFGFFDKRLMPNFLKSYGEKGQWMVDDYRYSFTTREYFDWIKNNGIREYEELMEKASPGNKQFMKMLDKDFNVKP